MKLLVGLFLLTWNVYALDSRSTPPADKPPTNRSADLDRVNVFANKNSMDQVLNDQKFQERFAVISNSFVRLTVTISLPILVFKEIN
jgi:hypothetical protein